MIKGRNPKYSHLGVEWPISGAIAAICAHVCEMQLYPQIMLLQVKVGLITLVTLPTGAHVPHSGRRPKYSCYRCNYLQLQLFEL